MTPTTRKSPTTRTKWSAFAVCCLGMSLCGVVLKAQQAGQVQGRVATEQGAGVPGAFVSISLNNATPSNRFAATVRSGGNGSFAFSNVPVGAHSVCVRVV